MKSLGGYSVYLVKEEGKKARRHLSAYKVQKPGVVASDQKKDEKAVLEPMGVNVKESIERLEEEKKVVSEGKPELKMKEAEEIKIAQAVEEKKTSELLKDKEVLKEEVSAIKEKKIGVVKKEEPEPKEPEKKEVIVVEALRVEKPKEAVKPAELPTLPEQNKVASLEPKKEKEQVPSEEVLKEEKMYLEDVEKVVIKEKKEEHEIAIKKEEVPEKVAEVKKPSEASDVGKVSKKETSAGKGKEKKVAKAEGKPTRKAVTKGTKKTVSAISKGKTSKDVYDAKKFGEAISQPTPSLAKADRGTPLEVQSGKAKEPSVVGAKGEIVNIKAEGGPIVGVPTSEKHVTPSQEDSLLKKEEVKQQTIVEIKPEVKEEKKPPLGIPVSDVLLPKDIKIEVFFHDADMSSILSHLLKKAHPMAHKKNDSEKPKEVDGIEEREETHSAGIPGLKRSFSVAKAVKAMYIFDIENKGSKAYKAAIVFRLFEGKAGEKIKEVNPVELSPNAIVKFKFILPEAVFWDDEYYFTGTIESSDTMTKFNDKTGLIWKEEKDY